MHTFKLLSSASPVSETPTTAIDQADREKKPTPLSNSSVRTQTNQQNNPIPKPQPQTLDRDHYPLFIILPQRLEVGPSWRQNPYFLPRSHF